MKMTTKPNTEELRLGKFLDHVLCHRPDSIGVALDDEGWAEVTFLLNAAANNGVFLDESLLRRIVAARGEGRFSFSADGRRIRANQGHSVDVELQLSPAEPPELLYHGTGLRFVASIREHGLLRQSRQHVHLAADPEIAEAAAASRGVPTVLTIRAHDMYLSGHAFFVGPNNVWLTVHVPREYIEFPEL